MQLKNYGLLVLFVLLNTFGFANVGQQFDFVVSKDGSGDFTTVQEAIDAVPHFRKERTTIFIKNGVYKEKLILPSSKNKVSFIGESVENTLITNDDYASKENCFGEEMGTTGSSGFYVFGNDFNAENITFENSAGSVGQAVAVRVTGDRIFFNNCRFLGNQDTLYPQGENSRQYYKNCYIEGTVDFIFGWSTAVFEDCEIFCKAPGYVTAASTLEETPFGFVFLHCKITGNAPAGSVYLGRPWRPYAKTAFIECELSEVIKEEGWHNWGKEEAERKSTYVEYQNTGEGANPKKRVAWAPQLTKEQRANYTLENIFDGWMPGKAFVEKRR
ncbi:pectinesterase family protein [Sunxiuqinia indica]|uniref:pectinesterase family protein n=1 Tax=Sunxiuqinia indica TaxID=2692584 RepID=UPI00135B20C2|nr:pectinesterase family protein [Sunxiuqinia indica]